MSIGPNGVDYTALQTIWPTLAAGTTVQKLTQLNAMTVAQTPLTNAFLTGAQIYNAVVPSEFQALSAAQQVLVRDIFGLGGNIDVNTGTNARTVMLNAFGAGTTTRTNLAALVAAAVAVPALPWWQANGYHAPINTSDLTAAGGLT